MHLEPLVSQAYVAVAAAAVVVDVGAVVAGQS